MIIKKKKIYYKSHFMKSYRTISSDPSCKDDNARFTTVFLKALPELGIISMCVFL